MKVLIILGLVILVVAIGPLCLMWGLNILLGSLALATIPITLKTWAGALLIGCALRGK